MDDATAMHQLLSLLCKYIRCSPGCHASPQSGLEKISVGVWKLIQAWEMDNGKKWTPIPESINALSSQDKSDDFRQSVSSTSGDKYEDLIVGRKTISWRHGKLVRAKEDLQESSFSAFDTPSIPPPIQASTPAVDLQWKPEWEPEVLPMEEKAIKNIHFVFPKNGRRGKKTRGKRADGTRKDAYGDSCQTTLSTTDEPGQQNIASRISDEQQDGFPLEDVLLKREDKIKHQNSVKTKKHGEVLTKFDKGMNENNCVEENYAKSRGLMMDKETIETKKDGNRSSYTLRRKRRNSIIQKDNCNEDREARGAGGELSIGDNYYCGNSVSCPSPNLRTSNNSSESPSLPSLQQRLSSVSKCKPRRKHEIFSETIHGDNTPNTSFGLTSPSINQRSAERIIRKYSNIRYPMFPTLNKESLVSKRKLFGKSPGWSRQKQMRRDMTIPSKRPLSVHRTLLALAQHSNNPAASNHEVSTSKKSNEKRSGRTKVMKNFLSRLRSRSRSRSRPYKAKVKSKDKNPSSTDVTFIDVIDLSSLPTDDLDDIRLESTHNHTSTIKSKVSLSDVCTPVFSPSHSCTYNSADNPISGTVLENAEETLMVLGSQDSFEKKSFSLMQKTKGYSLTYSKTSISEDNDSIEDVVLVPDSEMMRHKQQYEKCSDSDHRGMTNASRRKLHNGSNRPEAMKSVRDEDEKIESNKSNLRMELSQDGQILSFIRKGSVVREVSVADVWNRFEADDAPPDGVNYAVAKNMLTNKGQVSSTQYSNQFSIQDLRSSCGEDTSTAKVLFVNKGLYCTSESNDLDIRKMGELKHENTVIPEQETISSESSNEIGKVNRRKRRVIGSDEEEEQGCCNATESEENGTIQKFRRGEFDTMNSEAFNTAQANNLHREVERMEAELNELQNLERLIEAEMDGIGNGDSPIPDSVTLPEDDIVVQLTLGLDVNKMLDKWILTIAKRIPQGVPVNQVSQLQVEIRARMLSVQVATNTKVNHEKLKLDPKFTRTILKEKNDVNDEPQIIPSSQDELRSTLTAGLSDLPASQITNASRKEILESDSSHKSEEKNTKPMYLVASGLHPEDKNSIKRFCLQFGANYCGTYKVGTTTHVVMREDGSRPRVVQRTLKFFLGILGKSWLVTIQWIKDCLFADTLMDEMLFGMNYQLVLSATPFTGAEAGLPKIVIEDDYEVVGDSVCGVSHGGPMRARTIERPLFTDLYLCVVGELVDLSHEEFKLMVELGGGKCVPSPGQFPRVARKRFIIVDRQGHDFSETACKALFKRFRVPIVTRDWLFDSIARYCLYQPTGDYIIEARDIDK